jgi:hypothetical protein
MQINIPDDQLAGNYTTKVNVSSINDREIVKFYTEVNQIFDLSAFGVVHSDETSDKELVGTIKPEPGVAPGSILNYVFEVTNDGNAPDTILLTLTSVGEDWGDWDGIFIGLTNTEAYMTDVESLDFAEKINMAPEINPVAYLNSNEDTSLHQITVRLGVGQKVWVKVQISVPRDIPNTGLERRFNVEALSTDPDGILLDEDSTDNSVDIDLTVLFPDLLITGSIRHPSQISSGSIVTISAEIKNDGDIDAENVIVTFYVNGKEVKTQTITRLPKGATRLVPFTWQAMGGEHRLAIKVDPEDAIVESAEDNNERTKKVNVETSGFGEIVNTQMVCSLTPLILVAILIAIAVVWLKKKGNILGWKPGRGGEEEEEEL